MNYKESLKVLGGLLDAFDRDEHGDYFYERGWEVCEAMILAYGALENQPFWISVEERLPERDEKCLCRYTFGSDGVMYFCQVLDYYATDPQPHFQHAGGESKMRVTHWMPLPEPPKEEV